MLFDIDLLVDRRIYFKQYSEIFYIHWKVKERKKNGNGMRPHIRMVSNKEAAVCIFKYKKRLFLFLNRDRQKKARA